MSELETLSGVFRETFEQPDLELRPDLSPQDIENWDSMNHINLILGLESAFDVAFEVSEIRSITSVSDLLGLLNAKGVEINL